MERENREIKATLKDLEGVQQKYRLLQMKNLQLEQQHKVQELDAEKLKQEISSLKVKIQTVTDDRLSLQMISETLREEVTNKKATISRYKEINRKLTDKMNKMELHTLGHRPQHHAHHHHTRGGGGGGGGHGVNDTQYSSPDATVLYQKMNEMEDSIPRMDAMRKLEQRFNAQSRQYMAAKLENQSLKSKHVRLKKETAAISQELQQCMDQKGKLLDRVKAMDSMDTAKSADVEALRKQCDSLTASLNKKNADIQRLKSALCSLNQFLSNQEMDSGLTPGAITSGDHAVRNDHDGGHEAEHHDQGRSAGQSMNDETKNGDVSSHLIPKELRNTKTL